MKILSGSWLWRLLIAVVLVALAVWGWYRFGQSSQQPGVVSGNGRIEAVEVSVSTRTAGRVAEIFANEGDFIHAGQVLARMDTSVLAAQLREAQAQLQRAQTGVDAARSQVTQREAERAAALAAVAQRNAEAGARDKRLARTEELASSGMATGAQLDEDRASALAAKAAVAAAQAQVAAGQAAIDRARSDVIAAQSQVQATQATIERLQAEIDDSSLKAPRDGRVQYRVAQPGEVLAPGGVVLNMVDLSDIYMSFFLPTAGAGQVALDSQVRLVLDAAPQYVIPAKVSFVADVAQFTPKTVETSEERQKLMFRVKARIDPDLLRKHLHQVKTGLPGMAYLKTGQQGAWPPELEVRLPQ